MMLTTFRGKIADPLFGISCGVSHKIRQVSIPQVQNIFTIRGIMAIFAFFGAYRCTRGLYQPLGSIEYGLSPSWFGEHAFTHERSQPA